MKRFLPIAFLILSFCGFLTTQILWDTFSLNADQVSKKKERFNHFENEFKTQVFKSVDGKEIKLGEVKKPIIVLNFWASWCLPCLQEFPSLVEFHNKYKDQVFVLGINGDESSADKKIKETVKKYKLQFPIVKDPKSKVSDKFLINSYPVSLIFKNGKIVYHSTKVHDFNDKEFLKKLELL